MPPDSQESMKIAKSHRRWWSSCGRAESGQAMVEFMLVLPVIAVILFGITSFGIALNGQIDETHIVSNGARLAEVDATCGVGKQIKGTLVAGSRTLTVTEGFAEVVAGEEVVGAGIPSGTTVAHVLNEASKTWEMSKPATATVTTPEAISVVLSGASPTTCPIGVSEEANFLHWLTQQGDSGVVRGATATICSPHSKLGEMVEVRMTYTYNWMPVLKLKFTTTPITSTAQMVIEQEPRVPYPSCPS
jgi:Flp pilus assembly protein TadG